MQEGESYQWILAMTHKRNLHVQRQWATKGQLGGTSMGGLLSSRPACEFLEASCWAR